MAAQHLHRWSVCSAREVGGERPDRPRDGRHQNRRRRLPRAPLPQPDRHRPEAQPRLFRCGPQIPLTMLLTGEQNVTAMSSWNLWAEESRDLTRVGRCRVLFVRLGAVHVADAELRQAAVGCADQGGPAQVPRTLARHRRQARRL
eukprot:438681-Rhodomonas_salina.1